MTDDSQLSRRDQVRAFLALEYAVSGRVLDDLVLALIANLSEMNDVAHLACRSERWADLARAGHDLKGVASNVNQEELRLTGIGLEAAAQAADGQQARLRLATFDALLQELKEH